MGATDALKDGVHALTRATVNFFDEVLMLVIDRDTAELGNDRRPSR